jgi:hypothetical protein
MQAHKQVINIVNSIIIPHDIEIESRRTYPIGDGSTFLIKSINTLSVYDLVKLNKLLIFEFNLKNDPFVVYADNDTYSTTGSYKPNSFNLLNVIPEANLERNGEVTYHSTDMCLEIIPAKIMPLISPQYKEITELYSKLSMTSLILSNHSRYNYSVNNIYSFYKTIEKRVVGINDLGYKLLDINIETPMSFINEVLWAMNNARRHSSINSLFSSLMDMVTYSIDPTQEVSDPTERVKLVYEFLDNTFKFNGYFKILVQEMTGSSILFKKYNELTEAELSVLSNIDK